jgi:CMP-N,N'-diacetyllegionaminic acid synthase
MTTLAIIPARSGSKGIKDKNLRQLQGKTLIEWAVRTGLSTPLVTDVYISTDSALYELIGLNAGAKSIGLREKVLSGDSIKTVDVVIDLLLKLQSQGITYDFILLLQPTSPQRNAKDLYNLFQTLDIREADAVVSVSLLEDPHPYKLKCIHKDGMVFSFIKGSISEESRQNLPLIYRLTGAYYLIKTEALMKYKTFFPPLTAAFITEPIVNIDTEQDLDFLNFLIKSGRISLVC